MNNDEHYAGNERILIDEQWTNNEGREGGRKEGREGGRKEAWMKKIRERGRNRLEEWRKGRGTEGDVRIIRRRDSAWEIWVRALSCVRFGGFGRARATFYASFHAANFRKIIDAKLER